MSNYRGVKNSPLIQETTMEANNLTIDHTQIAPPPRITQAFVKARQAGRGALMPYFMCGYPTMAQSINVILAAAESGADIIELGMPFSDPLADGATVQHAGHVALEQGMSI